MQGKGHLLRLVPRGGRRLCLTALPGVRTQRRPTVKPTATKPLAGNATALGHDPADTQGLSRGELWRACARVHRAGLAWAWAPAARGSRVPPGVTPEHGVSAPPGGSLKTTPTGFWAQQASRRGRSHVSITCQTHCLTEDVSRVKNSENYTRKQCNTKGQEL